MFKKTDKENVYKDPITGALINTNSGASLAYKKQKRAFNQIKVLEQEQEKMKKEIRLLRETLEELSKRGKINGY